MISLEVIISLCLLHTDFDNNLANCLSCLNVFILFDNLHNELVHTQ